MIHLIALRDCRDRTGNVLETKYELRLAEGRMKICAKGRIFPKD